MEEKQSILIVDHEPTTRKALGLLLKQRGHEIEMATTGQEAMDKVEGRFFNLVLLDIELPDMEGIDLLPALKKIHPDMVIITMSEHASLDLAMRALNDAACAYITKPLNMDKVVVTVRDASEKQRLLFEKRRSDEALRKTSRHLEKTLEELRKANQKMLEQQKRVIEEELLSMLLQISGATAHELNQPLTVLLGNIELLKMRKDNAEGILDSIEKAGQRISDILKKSQEIGHYLTMAYPPDSSSISLHEPANILSVEHSDEDFEIVKAFLRDRKQTNLCRARDIDEAMKKVKQGQFDLILLDYMLPDGNVLDFLKSVNKEGMEIPVIVITAGRDELMASQAIQHGAYDYLHKETVSRQSLSRSISNTMEKARLKRQTREAQRRLNEL